MNHQARETRISGDEKKAVLTHSLPGITHAFSHLADMDPDVQVPVSAGLVEQDRHRHSDETESKIRVD